MNELVDVLRDEWVEQVEARLAAMERRERPVLHQPTVRCIVDLVALHTEISAADICGPSRPEPIAHARMMVCWLARRLTNASSTVIGAVIQREASTVRCAEATANQLMAKDAAFAATAKTILSLFRTVS
jgi:chromosomal replication initiation ATPase DnaA